MEIDTIIKSLNEICTQNKLISVTDDMLLDCATRIWSTKYINASKGKTNEGATMLQKETLKKFNIDFKPEITKKEASDLISKKIDSFSN